MDLLCGLSNSQPFCDGSKKTTDEKEGEAYLYDLDGTRTKLRTYIIKMEPRRNLNDTLQIQ